MNYWQLLQLRGAVRLEKVGMRHSSGRSARVKACKFLELPTTTKHDIVIQELNRLISMGRAI